MANTSLASISRENVFSRVPKNDAVTYSTFDRTSSHLSAFDASYLIPVFVDEVYPGDIFDLGGRHLARLLDCIRPFMSPLTLSLYFGYCPTRLVWNNFKAFMGERRRFPGDGIAKAYQVPVLNTGASGIEAGSIFNYAGIPAGVKNLEFSALPMRCINLFYNEWFRDENLCDWLPVGGLGDEDSEFGDSDRLENYKLFRRAKGYDYFTSALPFQQKGEAVSVSIGTTAPVVSASTGNADVHWLSNMAGTSTTSNSFVRASGYASTGLIHVEGIGSDTQVRPNLMVDLSNVTGFALSDLRTLWQLQAIKELNARTGTRYKEIINGEWNVSISDATLDRPEFLGSYKIPFNITTVASTAETTDNPQGNLSAYGFTDVDTRHAFTKAFEEHGFIVGFACVSAPQVYQQGLERFWSRKNRYDFYTPLLANISEQAIKQKEILAQGSDVLAEDGTPVDEKTFGYNEAWAELRYKPSRISGKMNSTVDKSLSTWHLGTVFEASKDGSDHNLGVPLNSDFIEDNTKENLQRVLALKDEPQIISDNAFILKCTRELPIYSVPAYLFGGRL